MCVPHKISCSQLQLFVTVAYRGEGELGGRGFNPPPPEIPKALQNRAKLNPIVKTFKKC